MPAPEKPAENPPAVKPADVAAPPATVAPAVPDKVATATPTPPPAATIPPAVPAAPANTPPATTPPTKAPLAALGKSQPVPANDEILAAEARLKETHKDQLAAAATKIETRPVLVEQFTKLAQRLLRPEDRFAYYAEATQLAVDSKDLALALANCGGLANGF